MSETLRERITRHEGKKLKPYTDTVGKLTIGIGRNLDDVGISDEEAYFLLDNDILKASKQLFANIPLAVNLDKTRQEVLIELVFWVGIGGLIKFKNMLFCLQKSDWRGAAEGLLDSALHRQVPDRTEELAKMLLTGES